MSRLTLTRLGNARRISYPEIDELSVLDALPDGSIVMIDPDTTTSPVLWGRVSDFWASLDPLAYPGERYEHSSLELFQLRVTPIRIRKLVLVWLPPYTDEG